MIITLSCYSLLEQHSTYLIIIINCNSAYYKCSTNMVNLISQTAHTRRVILTQYCLCVGYHTHFGQVRLQTIKKLTTVPIQLL